MNKRQKRLAFIVGGVALIAAAAALVLFALKDNVSLYFTPTQVANQEAPQGRSFRIGGLVEPGSIRRENDGLTVHFRITDGAKGMDVIYKGILPDLFKEGKGVVSQGKLEAGNIFRAEEVLAKHDENYMPPEAQHAIEQAALGNAQSSPASAVPSAR